jgi:hypothetical protein
MSKDRIRDAFSWQRSAARNRGIKFQFTFDEWVEWWEDHLGYRWFEKRGLHHGQYVMARNNDVGPYHPNNVQCILATENTAAGKYNCNHLARCGENHHNAKLTKEQVIALYTSPLGYKKLARQYGLNRGYVQDICRGKYWKHVTQNLPSRKTRASIGIKG